MGDIDKTRNRLNLENLEEADRKELFNKFIKHGGEVVRDKPNRTGRNVISKSSSRKYSDDNGEEDGSDNSKNYRDVSKNGVSGSKNVSKNEKKNFLLLRGFRLWVTGLSNGVIGFTGKSINYKFLNFIDKTVIALFLEMDTLIFNALNPVASTSLEAKSKHDKVISSFTELDDLELLERVKDMYDENVYKNFLRSFKELNLNTNPKDHVNDIKAMFRPIYILHLYIPKLKLAAEQALSAYAIVDNISKAIVNSRISAFKRAVDVIYLKYYPRLLALLQYASGEQLETSGEINRYLEIGEKDILGYYTILRKKMDKIKEDKIDNIKENIGKDKQSEKLDKVVSIGLKLIDRIVSFKKEDNSISSDTDPFYSVLQEDKIYRTKILLDMLDREYSSIFISNKVKYNVMYNHQNRTDYQGDFNNIFLTLSDMHTRLIEYSDMVRNINKIENDKSMRFEQRANLLSEKNGQRSYLAKSLRNTFISVINPLKKKLDKLLLDKEERERIIENPNDMLTFDIGFGKTKKRIQGYTIIKALTEAYYFISGVNYLITEGELSGSGILIDDFRKSGKTIDVSKDDKVTSNKNNEDIKEKEESREGDDKTSKVNGEEDGRSEDIENLNIYSLEAHAKDDNSIL